jgi:cation:H+ antiporter
MQNVVRFLFAYKPSKRGPFGLFGETVLINIFIIAIGFFILIKGSDFLVEGAASVAKIFNISESAVGLTIVAFGTSMPELFVSVLAGIEGNTDIAVGNVLGSNIANILLILGLSAVVCPLHVSKGTVWKEIPFSLLAAVVLCFLANDKLIDGEQISRLGRIDGLIFLCFFVIFIYYSIGIALEVDGVKERAAGPKLSSLKSSAFVLSGIAGLAAGGQLIVISAESLALKFGLSESFVGLTIVAVGTSLPELATSVAAAYKKNLEIAVGNVIGSNIFNVLFILGVSALVRPMPFSEASNVDIATVFAASLLLFATMFTGKKRILERWEGIFFIIFYAAYMAYLIWRL